MIDTVLNELKRNKVAVLYTLTAEHLQYSHRAIATILTKLFYLIITSGHIPQKFGMSFTVPLLKGDSICGRSINVEDFRGYQLVWLYQRYLSIVSLNGFQSL